MKAQAFISFFVMTTYPMNKKTYLCFIDKPKLSALRYKPTCKTTVPVHRHTIKNI